MRNDKVSVSNVSSGMVCLGGLLEQTRDSLKRFSELNGYDDWLGENTWVEFQWFAWLVAILKVEQDTVSLFPHGKWATIQRMEDLLREAAAFEIRTRSEINGKAIRSRK